VSAARAASTAPPLSVIIATTRAWPTSQDGLLSLRGQLAAVGGELIVMDGCGRGLPADAATRWPEVRWEVAPGASVFELRAQGIARATGAVVGITEDHCGADPRWVERTLAAHRAHPQAAAVAGPVLNGSVRAVSDWASFLVTFGPFLPPMRRAEQRVPPHSNISYKRWALPLQPPESGWLEAHLAPGLLGAGAIVSDNAIQVTHYQTRSFISSVRSHFHNGRATSGLIARHHDHPKAWDRVKESLRHGRVLLGETLRSTWARPGMRRWAVACAPAIALIVGFFTAGRVLGDLAGPGRSLDELY
jgi:hypothetical protein